MSLMSPGFLMPLRLLMLARGLMRLNIWTMPLIFDPLFCTPQEPVDIA